MKLALVDEFLTSCDDSLSAVMAQSYRLGLPLAYALGLGLWGLLALSPQLPLTACLGASLGIGVFILWIWLFRRGWRRQCAALVGAVLLGIGTGYGASPRASENDLAQHIGTALEIRVQLLTPPESRDETGRRRWRCVGRVLQAQGRPAEGKTQISFYATEQHLQVGDQLRFKALIQAPPAQANLGGFSYRRYLARQGIMTLSEAKTVPQLERRPAHWWVLRRLQHFREDLLRRLEAQMPRETARLLASLVVGEAVARVSEESAQNFRNSGLSHVLAVSGFQVQLLILSLVGLCRILRCPRIWSAGLSGIGVWLFVLFTGAPASVLRAAAIGSLGLVAYACYRQSEALSTLLWGAAALLMWNPLLLYDIGFQFSCLATLGLILHQQKIVNALDGLPPMLSQSLATILAAQLWVMPAQLFHFGSFSWLFLPANLGAGLIVTALTWLSLGALMSIYLLPVLSPLFIWPAHSLALGLLKGVALLLHLPQPVVYFRPLSLAQTLLAYALLILSAGLTLSLRLSVTASRTQGGASWLRRAFSTWGCQRGRLCILGALLLSSLSLQGATLWQKTQSCPLRVDFLNVGQGDAALLQSGTDVILVDAGPAWQSRSGRRGDAGERTILPFLRRQGLRRVDRVLISHAHLDHYGGLESLIGKIPIGEIWFPPGPIESARFRKLLRRALKHNIRLRRAQNGQMLQINGDLRLVLWQPLSPSNERAAAHDNVNNHSMVIQVIHKQLKLLFAGDLEHEAEKALLQQPGFQAAHTLLKVPHHGSRTSSSVDFLRAVRPDEAVVSVGQRNRFRHPSPKVLKRYEDLNARLWRTDRQGGICLCSQGKRYALRATLD